MGMFIEMIDQLNSWINRMIIILVIIIEIIKWKMISGLIMRRKLNYHIYDWLSYHYIIILLYYILIECNRI